MLSHLFQVGLQISQLRLQLLTVHRQYIQKLAKLHAGVSRAVVQVNDFLGLSQGEAQALGAQRQPQSGSISGAIDTISPPRARALWL